jgi:hypothetical protein
MGAIGIWISLGLSMFSALGALFLYVDGRTQRRALHAAESVIVALQAHVTGQEEQIVALSRTVVALQASIAPAPAVATAPALPPVARRIVSLTRDDDPIHTRETTEMPPPSPAPVTRPSTASGDARAARTMSDRPPPPVAVEDAARTESGLLLPLAPSEDAAIVARSHGLATAEEEAPLRTATQPRITRARPTLLGGMAGAPPTPEPSWVTKRAAQLVARGGDPAAARRQAEEEGLIANAAPGAKRDAPRTEARIRSRWLALVQEAGDDARHCQGERCKARCEEVPPCGCRCDGCALLFTLFVRAEREIVGGGR